MAASPQAGRMVGPLSSVLVLGSLISSDSIVLFSFLHLENIVNNIIYFKKIYLNVYRLFRKYQSGVKKLFVQFLINVCTVKKIVWHFKNVHAFQTNVHDIF